jgi:hypothetical protein
VLLLDEIEKAHPDLFNILLQIMDHGKLTDHNGKQIDFRNVILIMTTNAGAADLAKPAIGFAAPSARATTTRRSTAVRAGIPQPPRRGHLLRQSAAGGHRQGGREVRAAARGAACRPQRHDRAVGGGAPSGWSSTATTSDGRAADGRGDPGAHQEAPLADEVLFGELKSRERRSFSQ